MSETDQLAGTHLAPDPADLARLVAGAHHNPHSILGAHEYGDHTVIRAFRPHAVEVAAIVGDDRFPMQHIESGLFAVALPFVDLIDYRLQVSYQGSGAHSMCTPSPTPTASCPPWAKSTFTCSPRAATNDSGRSLAPILVRSPRPTAWYAGCRSRCGHPTPRASA